MVHTSRFGLNHNILRPYECMNTFLAVLDLGSGDYCTYYRTAVRYYNISSRHLISFNLVEHLGSDINEVSETLIDIQICLCCA